MENFIFSMPAEWERHQMAFIEWPVKKSLIEPDNYEEIIYAYARTAKAIARFEPVTVIAAAETLKEAGFLCGGFAQLVVIPHDDAWARDNGPTFVRGKNGRLTGLSWEFNAWGQKYPEFELDNKLAERLCERLGIPCVHPEIVLEGGSIHTDGEGTLLTTEQCLLNTNRNPGLSKEKIEENLKHYLNIEKIIWLKRGVFGDETDGHIDNIACFAAPGTVLLQTCRDKNDPNFAISEENRAVLSAQTDARGRKLRIVEIPQPPARFIHKSRLALSYINFYRANGGIVLPVFGGDAADTDKKAVLILKQTLPGCRIITVDGMPLIKEGGNVHCITQQMPEGTASLPRTAGKDGRI